jgi:hypothetical protein
MEIHLEMPKAIDASAGADRLPSGLHFDDAPVRPAGATAVVLPAAPNKSSQGLARSRRF